jgi:adenylate kinase family enzyme
VRRIAIKGSSGAGKSILAAALSYRLGLPHVELDGLHHGPNWAAPSAELFRARVAEVLDDERGWIVDGNYEAKLGTFVLDRADLIVWLDLPLPIKLVRLTRRTARRYLLQENLWNGNRETLRGMFWGGDALFTWAVRCHFRHQRDWPALLRGRQVVRLRSALETRAWLSALPEFRTQ